MYKAVIFDLDGVIVHTDHYHYLAWKKIADQEHIEFDKEINNRLRGISRKESLDIILEKANKVYSQDEKNSLTESKNKIYVESLKQLNDTQIIDGVMDVLFGLKQKKFKCAIGSSSKNAGLILKQLNLLDKFDVIIDGNSIERSKPFPDVFELAAKKLGVKPEECIVIEDAISGIEAAKNANMFGFALADAKSSNDADYCANNIREVLKLI